MTNTTELAVARQRQERHYRLEVTGDTFGPIHHRHSVTASEVTAKLSLDEVVSIPTDISWQKAHRNVTQTGNRYLMTMVATVSNPRFSVNCVDISRPGNTHTVDALGDLRAERDDDIDLLFVTNADAVQQILMWRGAEQLFDPAHFVGVTCPRVPMTEGDLTHLPLDKVTLLEVPVLAISSTDCRTCVQRIEPIRYPVPDGTVQYIMRRDLYPRPEAGIPVDNI